MKNTEHTPNDEPVNENISSGENLSFWFEAMDQPLSYEVLNSDIEADILVIGGGIAGLTTAFCLAKEGRKVVLVEMDLLAVASQEEQRLNLPVHLMIDILNWKKYMTRLLHNYQLTAI